MAWQAELDKTKPEVTAQTVALTAAWRDLRTCRPIGFGGWGPLPFTAVVAWAEFKGYGRDATDLVWHVMQVVANRMDELDAKRREDAKREAEKGKQ